MRWFIRCSLLIFSVIDFGLLCLVVIWAAELMSHLQLFVLIGLFNNLSS